MSSHKQCGKCGKIDCCCYVTRDELCEVVKKMITMFGIHRVHIEQLYSQDDILKQAIEECCGGYHGQNSGEWYDDYQDFQENGGIDPNFDYA